MQPHDESQLQQNDQILNPDENLMSEAEAACANYLDDLIVRELPQNLDTIYHCLPEYGHIQPATRCLKRECTNLIYRTQKEIIRQKTKFIFSSHVIKLKFYSAICLVRSTFSTCTTISLRFQINANSHEICIFQDIKFRTDMITMALI